jgi:putative SOS response-associated peptidase YedK
MCGRVDIHTPPAQLARALEAQLAAGLDPDGRPSWNVGPSRAIPAIVSTDDHQRVLDLFRWGLVPHWAKNPKVGGFKMINARAETAAKSNAYKGALKARRCLIAVDGFYEWAVVDPEDPKAGKVPFYFARRDGQALTFAGLYETWYDKTRAGDDGKPDPESYLQTCVIMTTEAGPDMTGVHDRMPVIIEPGDRDRWLDPEVQDPDALADLLKPAPAGTLVRHPVSREVNSVRNDGPGLISPDPEVDADLLLVPGVTETTDEGPVRT